MIVVRGTRARRSGATASNCNDYSIGIELEGLEGERFKAAQYAQLVVLLRALSRRYAIDAVVGHEHVAPMRKHDPGRGFDWDRLRACAAMVARAGAVRVAGLTRLARPICPPNQ